MPDGSACLSCISFVVVLHLHVVGVCLYRCLLFLVHVDCMFVFVLHIVCACVIC